MSFKRSDFPMLSRTMQGKPLVYLDSAATSLKPHAVIDAISHYYTAGYGTVHRAVYELAAEASARYSAVRSQVQRFLHARIPEEIVFTKGTTEAMNLVAFSFGEVFVKEGDEVIISGMEHHSNIVPWQLLCQRKKALLKIIPLHTNGTLNIDGYKKLLSSRTKLVSITHLSNVLGVVNPLPLVIEEAHRVGAKVLVDGAQSAPHLPLDMQALDCDFFAFSGHKIYGPTGIGVLYGKQDLLQQMAPYQGGGDMIETVTFEHTTFQNPPLKFEAGTPLIAEVMGLGAAFNYLKTYDFTAIERYETALIIDAWEQLHKIKGIEILGPLENRGSLVTLDIKGVHPLDLAMFLNMKGIAVRSGNLCAQPLLRHFGLQSALRLSVAPYNTKEEIAYFCSALQEALAFLSP